MRQAIREKKNIGPISLETQISCVKEEIERREKVYPPHIRANPQYADVYNRALLAMRAVLDTLTALKCREDEK